MGRSMYRRVLGFAGLPLLAIAVLVGVVVFIARYSDSAPAPTPVPDAAPTPVPIEVPTGTSSNVPTPSPAAISTSVPTDTPTNVPTRVSATLPDIDWPPGPREWSTRSGVEYSKADLDAWHEQIADTIHQIPGVSLSGVEESENHIAIDMYGRRGAREAVEAAVARAGVPRDAVVVRSGCGPFRPGQPPNDAFLRAVDFSLDMAPEASHGATVRMKLTLTNVSDESIVLTYDETPHDFVVTTPDGTGVWYWTCGKIFVGSGIRDTMRPGAIRVFTGSWEQVDNQGEEVPPGTYIVHAAFNYDWGDERQFRQLVTPPHQLEVLSE